MPMDQLGSLAIGAAPVDPDAPAIEVSDTVTHGKLDSIIALLTHMDNDLHDIKAGTDYIGTQSAAINSNTFDIKVNTDSMVTLLTHIDGDFHTANARLLSIYNQAIIAQGVYDAIAFHTQEINTNTDQIILNQTNGTQRSIITDGTNNANLGLGNVDAMPNSNYGVFTNSRSFIYGGAGAWDRVRSVQIGNNTIGTGLLAAGAWAQLPNGNYSAILLDANRKMDIRPLTAAVDTVTVSGFTPPVGGFATEPTLQSVLTQVTAINANTDTVEALVTATNAALATLNAKDFATQTTLAALNAKFNSLGQKTMANSHPVVLASDQSTIPVSSAGSANIFHRIKNKEFKDTEEVRYDIPAALASGFIYTGLATIGTATATAAWSIIRTSFDANGNPTRDQYRTGLSWDGRAAGW